MTIPYQTHPFTQFGRIERILRWLIVTAACGLYKERKNKID